MTQDDFRVQVDQRLGQPAVCQVWRNGQLIFSGSTGARDRLTVQFPSRAVGRIRELHRRRETWRGWRGWIMKLALEPRAYVSHWCDECDQEWPCRTIRALTKEN